MVTTGTQRYRNLIPIYTRNSQAIILAYSVSERASFLGLDDFQNNLITDDHRTLKYLVALKTDVPGREVTREEGERKAEELECTYAEMSSKVNREEVEKFMKFMG